MMTTTTTTTTTTRTDYKALSDAIAEAKAATERARQLINSSNAEIYCGAELRQAARLLEDAETAARVANR